MRTKYAESRVMQDEYAENRAGKRLRDSIELRGESLAAFARATRMPYRSLQDYVAGKSKPGFEQLARMAAGGLDVGYILTGFPTGSTDHPSPSANADGSLWYSETTGTNSGYIHHDLADRIAANARAGLDLKSWIAVWNALDDEAGDLANAADIAAERRQAVVFAQAAAVAKSVADRLRALGMLGHLPVTLPLTHSES